MATPHPATHQRDCFRACRKSCTSFPNSAPAALRNGYLKQRANEAEVLFTFIAERYERRPIIVTSNLVLSQWEEIFQSPMATAAAIDRIVHHSVITKFDVPSYRTAAAQKQATKSAPTKSRTIKKTN
jgi:hypothetical protein